MYVQKSYTEAWKVWTIVFTVSMLYYKLIDVLN